MNSSRQLRFAPVMESHAEVMYSVLSDEKLYLYTGGKPPGSIVDLEKWFGALESRKSADGNELWLTWILYTLESCTAIGYVQATITADQADIAWMVGVEWQGNGYASEAASALVSWLVRHNTTTVSAHINPGHVASQKVAMAAGLNPSGQYQDGEEIWLS